MKQTSPARRIVTIAACSLLLLTASFSLLSFKMKQASDDFWQKLGITKIKGEANIKESFMSGYFHYYGAKTAKNLLLNDRAAIAKELMQHARQQLQSEQFRKEYAKQRNSAKPTEYPYSPKAKEDLRKEKIAEMEKSVKDAEALVKKMPDMEKDMRPVIDMFKKNLKDYADPNSEMIEMFYQNELSIKEQREQSYKEQVKRWQESFPENPDALVKSRLEHFVKVAKTVDFNAQLKVVGDKKKFVNSKYEYQSTEWKQIFRAGKEVILPAIDFAEDWIKELK